MKVIILITSMIIFDWITGFINAWNKGEISSTKMRKGIMNKVSELGLMLLGKAIDLGCVYLDIPTGGLQFYFLVNCYIFLMEVLSVYENLRSLNNNLKLKNIEDFVDDKMKIIDGGKKDG